PLAREMGPLMARVREIAATTEKVHFTDHAAGRMWERNISDMDVFRALRLGEISGLPWYEDDGSKACKVTLQRRGDRTVGVVTSVIEPEGELVVKTVEWED